MDAIRETQRTRIHRNSNSTKTNKAKGTGPNTYSAWLICKWGTDSQFYSPKSMSVSIWGRHGMCPTTFIFVRIVSTQLFNKIWYHSKQKTNHILFCRLDCGMFVMFYMDQIAKGQPIPSTMDKKIMIEYRANYISRLLHHNNCLVSQFEETLTWNYLVIGS